MLGRTITRSILRSRIRPRRHIQEVFSSLTILLVGSFGGSCCLGLFFNNHCSIVRSASASASTTTEQNSSGPSSGSRSSSDSTCSTFTLDYFNNGGCSWEKERRHPYRPGNSFLLATSAFQNINSSEDANVIVNANANGSAKTDANASVGYPCGSVSNARTYSTDADTYFQKHHRIPLPSIMHESLDAMILKDDRTRTLHVVNNAEAQVGADCEDEHEHENKHENKKYNKEEQVPASNKILVIGDVHGCFNELKSLHAKAMKEHNDNKHFAAVVLVGDLCNKGPDSAKVIQFVRNEYGWYSVRGNHDNSGLAAALGAGVGNGDGGGGGKRCVRPKYEWVYSLSDDDVAWMEGLPYTIRIPKTIVSQGKQELGHQHQHQRQHHHKNEDENAADDVIIVHAGFVPNIDLDDQETQTMITIRDIVLDSDPDSNTDAKHYKYHKLSNVNIETDVDVDVDVEQEQHPQAWARTWDGPNLVIFGHDAKRGIQHERFAIGLDSGACYGKKLTGIVLPEKEFVAVDAEKVHCPIN